MPDEACVGDRGEGAKIDGRVSYGVGKKRSTSFSMANVVHSSRGAVEMRTG